MANRNLYAVGAPRTLTAAAGAAALLGLVSAGCSDKRETPKTQPAVSAAACPPELVVARQKLVAAQSALVGVGVTDLMERPDASSPLADQALLGDAVRVLPPTTADCAMPAGLFVLIETEARYRGYAAVSALVPQPDAGRPYRSGPLLRVSSRFANVYPQPDLTKSNPMVVLPLGVAVRPDPQPPADRSAPSSPASAPAPNATEHTTERWIAVLLPDGRRGFAQRGDLRDEPRPPTPTTACIVEQALLHEGSPYLWGGRSTYGIDCSGLVANAYGACGVVVPRDAHLQFDWEAMQPVGEPTPESISALQAGDLLFFVSASAPERGPGSARSEKPKITHVGIYLGDGRFVHATTSDRPLVQKSQLLDAGWQKRWAGSRRYRQLVQAAAQLPSPPS